MLPPLIVTTLLVILGAVFGSFFNVLIYRIPQKLSIITPSSHCPACGKPVLPRDNIPVLSYLLLGGKCRHCQARISFRYPVIEITSALLLVLAWFVSGETFGPDFLRNTVFLWLSLVITVIDIEHMLIPDLLVFPLLFTGLLSSFVPGSTVSPLESLGGALLGLVLFLVIAFFYVRIKGVEGMGHGDIKYMAALGSFTGPIGIIFVMYTAAIVSLVVMLGIRLFSRPVEPVVEEGSGDADSEDSPAGAFPFGPFLAFGGLLWILVGDAAVNGWLSLFF